MADGHRCWLVDRRIDDGRTVTTTYALADGSAIVVRQRALSRSGDTPVSIEVDADDLAPVDDPDERERYRQAVEGIRTRRGPDEGV